MATSGLAATHPLSASATASSTEVNSFLPEDIFGFFNRTVTRGEFCVKCIENSSFALGAAGHTYDACLGNRQERLSGKGREFYGADIKEGEKQV